jgi:hypothetical protein
VINKLSELRLKLFVFCVFLEFGRASAVTLDPFAFEIIQKLADAAGFYTFITEAHKCQTVGRGRCSENKIVLFDHSEWSARFDLPQNLYGGVVEIGVIDGVFCERSGPSGNESELEHFRHWRVSNFSMRATGYDSISIVTGQIAVPRAFEARWHECLISSQISVLLI